VWGHLESKYLILHQSDPKGEEKEGEREAGPGAEGTVSHHETLSLKPLMWHKNALKLTYSKVESQKCSGVLPRTPASGGGEGRGREGRGGESSPPNVKMVPTPPASHKHHLIWQNKY